jgi:hypothetical protein
VPGSAVLARASFPAIRHDVAGAFARLLREETIAGVAAAA